MIGAFRSSRQKICQTPIILADLLENTCLLHRVQKVMVCDLWLVDFDPFCEFLCFMQGSFPVIISTTNGSEKRNRESGFWASEFACFWKAQLLVPKEYILQQCTHKNHQRDNTHRLNHKSCLHFRHNMTFTLTSKHALSLFKSFFSTDQAYANSFSGVTTKAMKDYLKPKLELSPD